MSGSSSTTRTSFRPRVSIALALRQREAEVEPAAHALLAREAHLAAVTGDDLVADVQADAHPPGVDRGVGVGAVEALEDPGPAARGDAHAVVGDGDERAAALPRERHLDLAAPGRVAHGVVEEALEHLGEPL